MAVHAGLKSGPQIHIGGSVESASICTTLGRTISSKWSRVC